MKLGSPITSPEGTWEERNNWYRQYVRDNPVIRFPHADSYAVYAVKGDTLHHVPVDDAWQSHPALIRGLTQQEVQGMLNYEAEMERRFPSPPPNNNY